MIRFATRADDAALVGIDARTWSGQISPAPAPPPDRPFFRPGIDPADVLVFDDGEVRGYAGLGPGLDIPANAHVMRIASVAVDPAAAGRGVGAALVGAAVAEAHRRGAAKVTLRVLGSNPRAQRLYERCGFVVEGVLRGEFRIDGRDVDDVLMAHRTRS